MKYSNRNQYQHRQRPGNLCIFCGKSIAIPPRAYRWGDNIFRPVLNDKGLCYFEWEFINGVQATAHVRCAIDDNPDEEYI
jgi:hypothetical protein